MQEKSLTKGYIAAIVSACSFGFIPLFVLPLFQAGYTPTDILVYRTLFSCIGLAIYMLVKRVSFTITFKDFCLLALGGVLYFFSAWLLLIGYTYISSGLATTIHFSYPVFVTLLLFTLLGYKPSQQALLSVLLAVVGVAFISLLSSKGAATGEGIFTGVVIILISGLTYAGYIVELKHTRLSRFPGFRVTLYVMMVAGVLFATVSLLTQGHIAPLRTPSDIINATLLAFVPTILSNLALVIAVKSIGSSKTAVLGALEPLTALVIGVTVFGESLSIGSSIGVLLILLSVYLVIHDRQHKNTTS